VKKVLKIAVYTILGLLAFVILVAGFTQTQVFRDRLRAAAIAQLHSLLAAEVGIGELRGNLVTGFSVDHISIKVQENYLVLADRLDIRYSLFEIPGKSITISTMTLVRPSVELLRGRDGQWNFERMIRPTPPDTSASSPFPWVVSVKRLDIVDGTVTIVDSAALDGRRSLRRDSRYVDYHHITLDDVNLTTGVLIRSNEKRFEISSLTFHDEMHDVRLKRFAGDFSVRPDGARVEDMIITTERSDLRLDASMNHVDLFGSLELRELQHKPVHVSLRAPIIDLNELQKFIPELAFLNGTVSMTLEAEGEFGGLRVEGLDLATGSSVFHVAGDVENLHHPSDLYLNVKLTECTFHPQDANALLPVFGLPEYGSLGPTTLDLEFTGRPLDFRTKFQWQTVAGVLRSDSISLTIGGQSTLRYFGEVVAHDFNLGKLLNNERLNSRLNGVLKVDGEGTSFEYLAAQFRVEIDSSEFMEQQVGKTQILVDAREKKLTSTIVAAMGRMRSDVTGELNLQDENNPSFAVEGDILSLNLEDFLHDKTHNSDLTMSLKATGTNLSWDKLSGDFRLGFSSSRYREYSIKQGDVHLVLDQDDPLDKEFRIESNIADFSLTGSFNTVYIADLIDYEVQNLRIALGEKIASLDSTFSATIDRRALMKLRRSLSADHDTLDAHFSLTLKDLEPISVITGNRTFNGRGVLSGWMRGDYHNLSLYSRLSLEDFFYGNVESGVLIQGGSATLEMQNLKPTNPFGDLEVKCVTEAAKVHVNRTELDSLRLTLTYQQGYSRYTAMGTFDRDVHVILQGLANVSEDQVVFTLNDLRLAYQDFAWTVDGGAAITFSTHGVRVGDFIVRRNSQVIALKGHIGIDGDLDASFTATHIDVDALKYLMSKEELGQLQHPFAGRADLSVIAKGTADQPVYNASLHVQDVSFRGVPLGTVQGDLSYAKGVLLTRVDVVKAAGPDAGEPQLIITGTIPMNLALTRVAESERSDSRVNLTIQSDGVQLSILDPLLPTFNDLKGIMKCNLKIAGSLRDPNYRGHVSIENCSFLFVPNNVYYTFEGKFQPEGDRITVLTATVRNTPQDNDISKREGIVHLSGDFSLRELKPTDFDIKATGQLLLVKQETRTSSLSVYGNLFVEIGETGLRFTGTLERSLLKGSVLVRNSTLIFPPTQETVTRESRYFLPVVVIDDTSKPHDIQRQSAAARYFGAVADSFIWQTPNGMEAGTGKSFLDGVRYDLDIETAGRNTVIQIIFDTQTDEKLVANIEGNFSIADDGKRWIGDLRVTKAFYNFFKRFDAEGSLRYTGDFLNPELDIKTTYQGTRTLEVTTTSIESVDKEKIEKVVVNVDITGTRNKPIANFSMTIDGVGYQEYTGPKSDDVQNDAIIFIVTGTFGTSESERNAIGANIRTTAQSSVVSGATSLLTGKLSELLRAKTFINAIEFRYGAGESFTSSPEVRVSATVYHGLVNFGGRIYEGEFDISNLSLQYSLGDIFSRPALRNFMVEFERKVDRGSTGLSTEKREVNSARLFYRFSF